MKYNQKEQSKHLYRDRLDSIASDEERKPLREPHHRFQVSNYGRIRCGSNRPRVTEVSGNRGGRKGKVGANIRDLTQGGKMICINIRRAVYKLYVGEIPEGMEVTHKDGNFLNCYYKNLFITDDIGVNINAKEHGHNDFIPPISKTKLSKETLSKIRKERKPRKVSTTMLAKKYGISQAHVVRILHDKEFGKIR